MVYSVRTKHGQRLTIQILTKSNKIRRQRKKIEPRTRTGQSEPSHETAREVAETFRQLILRGAFENRRLPTLRELERGGFGPSLQLPVTRHVARLAFAILFNEGLIESRGKAGTFVRQAHNKRDRIGRPGLIAVMAPSSAYQFINKAVDGMMLTIDETNSGKPTNQRYRLVRVSSDGDRRKEERLLRELERDVDGLILLPVNTIERDDESKAAFEQCRMPLLLIGRDVPGIDVPGWRLLYPENEIGRRISQFIIEKLLLLGSAERLSSMARVVVVGERANSSLRNRSNETVQALSGRLSEAGADPSIVQELLLPTFREAAGDAAVERLHSESLIGPDWRGRTWIVCMTDLVALGVMHALWIRKARGESGFRVPEDIYVMGVDGDSWGEFMCPSLTTLELLPEQIGKLAAKVMIETLEGKGSPITPIMTVPEAIGQLRQRESTGDNY